MVEEPPKIPKRSDIENALQSLHCMKLFEKKKEKETRSSCCTYQEKRNALTCHIIDSDRIFNIILKLLFWILFWNHKYNVP